MTGSEIQKLRHKLGWTQRELAIHLDLTDTTISRWERGVRTRISSENIAKLKELDMHNKTAFLVHNDSDMHKEE